jgi:hypothetical protein
MSRFPGVLVVLLFAVGHATSGAFALGLGLFYYYIKVSTHYPVL